MSIDKASEEKESAVLIILFDVIASLGFMLSAINVADTKIALAYYGIGILFALRVIDRGGVK